MNRLKDLRLEARESQEYVGTLIGVSGQAVGQYEMEKRDLSPDKILKLAEHYNCSTDYLLGKSDIRNPEELKNVQFANYGGLDTDGLDEEELEEIQRQIDFIKKMKGNR